MHVLEAAAPLSQSMVWRLQRTFYSDQGVAAWSQSNVPQSVTTSPNIARAYARVALGFLRDLAPSLDLSQPVYVVELGAGSGRFAYRFLKAFSRLLGEFFSANLRFVYVMTDASPSVVDFWRDNPRLRGFVEDGVLDFAHFDILDIAPLQLINSGITLRAGEVANPVIWFGNYIFDSVPQDAYTIKNGELFLNLVTLSASEPKLDLTAPDAKVRISITFETDSNPTEVGSEPDPILREILQRYSRILDETTFMIPRSAMACTRFFRELGHGRAMCLIADFGDTREDELPGHGPPGFGAGGGFWLPVNFHALGEFARGLGGHVRHPDGRHLTLNISMLLFAPDGVPLNETQLAYTDVVDQHGPDDLAAVNRALADQLATLKIESLVALMRSTGWDPDYVARCLPRLVELTEMDARMRAELVDGVQHAWDQYFPIGEAEDIPFALGVILFGVQHYVLALEFFERSLQDFGVDPRTTVNVAMTLYHLGRLEECLQWLDRTLALDPDNELATTMRADVANDLSK